MAQHTYGVGDKVVVFNQTLSGKPVREGEATIRKLLDRDDRYMVSFAGEREQYERYVPADN